MTIEQQKAIAIAKARQRMQQGATVEQTVSPSISSQLQRLPLASEAPTPSIEPALQIGSAMAAEPIAGIAGLLRLPGGVQEAVQTIEQVRQALTIEPFTEEGQQRAEALQQKLQPITEFFQNLEQGLGETGFQAAGPVGGAIGQTLPTLGLIALGTPQVRGLSGKLTTQSAKNLLKQAAPTTEGLKNAARGIYNDIDNLGAVVSADSIGRLGDRLRQTASEFGFHPGLQPKSNTIFQDIQTIIDNPQQVTRIDTLRRLAGQAKRSLDPSDAELASRLIDDIDDFLDDLKPNDFISGPGIDIGTKYKDARQLWQRARKSEVIEDVIDRASRQASGFENGLRVQFNSLLNNKKKIKNFTPEEVTAMKDVVEGGPLRNTVRALGKFGVVEGRSTSMLLSSLGGGAGFVAGGLPGAIAVPLIGQTSRVLARHLTKNKAELTNAIVRSGRNGTQIVNEYLKSVPKGDRNPADLADLLIKRDATIKNIPAGKDKFMLDTLFLADFMQSQIQQQQVQ